MAQHPDRTTDMATYRLNQTRGQFSKNTGVKKFISKKSQFKYFQRDKYTYLILYKHNVNFTLSRMYILNIYIQFNHVWCKLLGVN